MNFGENFEMNLLLLSMTKLKWTLIEFLLQSWNELCFRISKLIYFPSWTDDDPLSRGKTDQDLQVSLVVVHGLIEIPDDLVVVTPPDPNRQVLVPGEPLHATGVEANIRRLLEQHALGNTRENQTTDLGEIESLGKAVAVLRDREDLGAPVVVGQELAGIDRRWNVHDALL